MRWVLDTLLSIGFFVVGIVVLLLMFNSFMTIAVLHTGNLLGSSGIDISGDGITGMAISTDKADGVGMNINIARTGDGGFIVQTNDGAMKMDRNGIDMIS